ncbi:MAG: methyltransferase domain-containing protein [Candidatus Obscuribacterales bacterium]|nr:methyltransferase domain-containing protein [Candidatus Obscuribacterales bacterium]
MLLRNRVDEMMDNPSLDVDAHKLALRDLSRLNRFSCSVDVLWGSIQDYCFKRSLKSVRLLDVATGSGDILIELEKRGRCAGLQVNGFGCDISSVAVSEASRRTESEGAQSRFFVLDPVRQGIEEKFDIATVSLFTHHLSDEEVVLLLRNLSRSANLILVNDLARSSLNWYLVFIATRVLSRSPVVHFDGPASVCNAFTPEELRSLAHEAGLLNCKVENKFPCRMLLQWSRTNDD